MLGWCGGGVVVVAGWVGPGGIGWDGIGRKGWDGMGRKGKRWDRVGSERMGGRKGRMG